MMRETYLHIGLAKTGTTAIQTALAAARPRLEAGGVLFPHAGTINRKGGHHCLAWRLARSPRFGALCSGDPVADLAREVAATPARRIVISSEDLSAISYDELAVGRLMAALGGTTVSTVVYVREQVEWFSAFYAECLKELVEIRSIGEFINSLQHEPRYHYADWMRLWRARTSRLIVRPFVRSRLEGGDVVSDFICATGLDDVLEPGDVPARAAVNQTLAAARVAAFLYVARRLKFLGLTPEALGPELWLQHKRRLIIAIQEMPDLEGQPFWGIGRERAREIRDAYRASNRAFLADNGLDPDALESAAIKPLNRVHPKDLSAVVLGKLDRLIDPMFSPRERALSEA